jgi:hypothetical protein
MGPGQRMLSPGWTLIVFAPLAGQDRRTLRLQGYVTDLEKVTDIRLREWLGRAAKGPLGDDTGSRDNPPRITDR